MVLTVFDQEENMTASGAGKVLFLSVIAAIVSVAALSRQFPDLPPEPTLKFTSAYSLVYEPSAKRMTVERVDDTLWPVANKSAKADKLPILDSEAGGDVADAKESTFDTRYAALEQK